MCAFIITFMSLLVAVRPCILHEGIAYCPRSGHVLNLDYAVEYLLSRIAHHTFIKGYKVETPVFLQVTFNEDATVTNCDFSRDVRPAKYLQYTCDLLYPSISLDFLSTSAICNFEYRQRAGGRTTQYTVEELRSEAVVDYTYWGSDHTTPNMICVSTLGVYGAALRKLGNASNFAAQALKIRFGENMAGLEQSFKQDFQNAGPFCCYV